MIRFQAHDKPLTALAFSPDGRFLATANTRANVHVWGESFAAPAFVGVCKASWWASLAFSPDGRHLGYTGKSGVMVWDLAASRSPIWTAAPPAQQCCFSADGKVFFAAINSRPLRRWRVADWAELPAFGGGMDQDSQGHHRVALGQVYVQPGENLIAVPHAVIIRPTPPHELDTVVQFYDAATGEECGELRRPFRFDEEHPAAYAFSPSGRHLAAIHGPGVRVWDVEARSEITYVKAGRRKYRDLAFVADGSRLATVCGDETVRLWDTTTWAEMGGYRWDVGGLSLVAASPDGMRMAAGGSSGQVVVWDVD